MQILNEYTTLVPAQYHEGFSLSQRFATYSSKTNLSLLGIKTPHFSSVDVWLSLIPHAYARGLGVSLHRKNASQGSNFPTSFSGCFYGNHSRGAGRGPCAPSSLPLRDGQTFPVNVRNVTHKSTHPVPGSISRKAAQRESR